MQRKLYYIYIYIYIFLCAYIGAIGCLTADMIDILVELHKYVPKECIEDCVSGRGSTHL